ncbi:MAG: bacteriophage holin [Candidatus Neomarinimicrobiota bacterium]
MKLNVKAVALSCGLVCGVGLFLLTWWVIILDGATGEATVIARVYRGYSISAGGSFIGLLYGLADGVIGGAIFAWLYNRFAAKFNAD